MSWVLVLRTVLVLVFDAVALILLAAVLPGLELADAGTAVLVAAVAGLLNALVWPVLARYTLPLNVLTLGFAALVLNGALVALAVVVTPGAQIHDWWTGIIVAFGLATLTALLSALFAIEEDDSWYRNVVKRQERRRGDFTETDVPGVLFLEIDGLAYDVVRRAMRDGNAPTLSRWLREGSHRIVRWETDWSSQTGACQAGLLHGDNDDMPAFRWWEKDRGAAIVTNHPRDAEEIERRRSNGRGLLHGGGASRANILSGDATHSMLTMSTVLRRRRPIGRDYAAYFSRPYAVVRTFVRAVGEIARERRAAGWQRRHDVQPRIDRSRTYATLRAWATVVQLDLQVAAVVGDVLAGRPAVYTTFLAYDEVAHHSGIERPDALAVLRGVDRQLARIEAALADAPRPYRLVVLSDHGQSQGATFLQRYGTTLEQLVDEACEADHVQAASGGSDEALAYLSAGLTELARDDTVGGRAVRTATKGKLSDGAVALDEDVRRELAESRDGAIVPEGRTGLGEARAGTTDRAVATTDGAVATTDGAVATTDAALAPAPDLPELSVMASGNLGLISFPRQPGRVTLEWIERCHPRMIATLREHPGIGFVLVRSERDGPVVLGANGVHHLDDDRVEGEDPLAPYGPTAANHVRRTDAFEHCPDLLVNSTWWEDMEEVAAFEELVGSHGGMGGTQSFPFLLFPVDLPWPDEPVVGACTVHGHLRRWLHELGHDGYGDESATLPPGGTTRTSTAGASSAT